MKQIFFYIYPEKEFAKDYVLMSQAQIENSLEYWDPKDILVVTNFPWEYKGVKSLVVEKDLISPVQSHGTSLSNKPLTITYLIKNNLVDDINWFHDWDIWQLAPLDLPPIKHDIALVDYSYKSRIQLGSIFFKPSSLGVFEAIVDTINTDKINEEEATNKVMNSNYDKLNVTYNLGMKNLESAIQLADKPLRVAHFPPYKANYLHKANVILPPKLATLLNNRFRSMKNLLIYISPNKKFNPEHKLMLEVQIDNSLQFWDKRDLILFTNFPYEYNGIKAVVGPDDLINKSFSTNKRGIINSKINAIIYLLENKIINELTWFHDFDSFQLAPLDLPVINTDLGVVGYGIYPQNKLQPLPTPCRNRINFGNIFFKPESLDIFKLLLEKMDREGLYEEDAMSLMLEENHQNISKRVQIMNQTYNIGMRCVRSNIEIADKPLKVAHFPPHDPRVLHKFSKIIPPKLAKMLNEKFTSLS